jgi:hypothetical protein
LPRSRLSTVPPVPAPHDSDGHAPADARFVLGIDPGAETGLAGVRAAGGPAELVFVTSAGPLATIRQLDAWAAEGVLAGAYVEDSRALPIYARHGRAGRGERDRIARSVGRVDGLTDLYLDVLAALGVPTQTVEPVKAAKWSADDLARMTGWTARCNVHGRDAARLVIGRGVPRDLFTAGHPMQTVTPHARARPSAPRRQAGATPTVAQPATAT